MSVLRLPAPIDIHVHLREPSSSSAENIKSGSESAKLGGMNLICDMPNNPGNPTWSGDKVSEKVAIATKSAQIPVIFYAGSQPESDNLGEFSAMVTAGAVGLKLYGAPTTGNYNDYTAEDFRPIIETWHNVAPEKPILLHAGKDNLEDLIELITGEFKHRLHICHVHAASQVAIVKKYKDQGRPLTCGVCPHHLFKTSHDTYGQGWFARMQPPLQHQDEAENLINLLASGDIDLVESDHAPHLVETKLVAEATNQKVIHEPGYTTCFGVPGVEFVIPLLLNLYRKDILSKERLIEATHSKPIEVLGKEQIPFDISQTYSEWDISDAGVYRIGDNTASLTNWSPYTGFIAGGTLLNSVINGNVIYKKEG